MSRIKLVKKIAKAKLEDVAGTLYQLGADFGNVDRVTEAMKWKATATELGAELKELKAKLVTEERRSANLKMALEEAYDRQPDNTSRPDSLH